jgi:hypothetical protein
MARRAMTVQVPPAVFAVAVGIAALFLSLATINFTNDHFGRISPARQIAFYGELPFRDFLDPGYFLTELTSAALLRVLGDNLLGEWLLTSAFFAGGTVLVWLLAYRVSQSRWIALVAAAVALVSFPRAYDYDKVLFYPLGLWCCWRYVAHRRPRDLWVLAGALTLGALFRYDTAVYVGCAALTVIAVAHADDWRIAAKRATLFAGALVCFGLPCLAALQYSGGVVNALDQMMAYGRRETARTRISQPLPVSLGALFGVESLEPPAVPVYVRWAQSVDDVSRQALESKYGLRNGARDGAAEDRTWFYRAEDISDENLRALVQDSRVDDTHGIDRAKLGASEPLLERLARRIPALRWRILPGAWTFQNANAFLYYLLRWLPFLAAATLLVSIGTIAPWLRSQTPQMSRSETAQVLSLIVTCVLLNLFILRDPVYARVGGMAGPMAVLSAWMAKRVLEVRTSLLRRALTLVMVSLLGVTLWSLSAATEWERRLTSDTLSFGHIRGLASVFGESQPRLRSIPNSRLAGMVSYLRECTSQNDRILALWFVPELYFYAQRGFVGSVATFGGHWSEPRFQERIAAGFRSRSVPVVITEASRYNDLITEYSLLGRLLGEHYVVAGETSFGDYENNYTLLVDKTRAPVRTHPATGMPCF